MRQRVPVRAAVHLDVDIRVRRGEIHKDNAPWACSNAEIRPVSVTMPVTLLAAENDPIFNGRPWWRTSSVSQVHGVDVTVSVLGNHHDVRDGLAPREFVGMMLERSDEDHRPLLGRDDITEVVTVVQTRGDAESEDADELVDRAGATGSGENHHSVRVAAEGLHDDRAGVFAEPRGLQTGAAGLGMSVGVTREHLVPDEVLQEAQRSTRRGVVGVGDPAWPIRSWHDLVIADDGSRIRRSNGVSRNSRVVTPTRLETKEGAACAQPRFRTNAGVRG